MPMPLKRLWLESSRLLPRVTKATSRNPTGHQATSRLYPSFPLTKTDHDKHVIALGGPKIRTVLLLGHRGHPLTQPTPPLTTFLLGLFFRLFLLNARARRPVPVSIPIHISVPAAPFHAI
jgi:hypothetical protein